MNSVSPYRNNENRSDSSPRQGISRGTARQITGFFYEYGNEGRREAPIGPASYIASVESVKNQNNHLCFVEFS